MKLLFNAIQAVTVEFCGVILVVGMLYGLGAVGLRSTGVGASEAQVKETLAKQLSTRLASDTPIKNPPSYLTLVRK